MLWTLIIQQRSEYFSHHNKVIKIFIPSLSKHLEYTRTPEDLKTLVDYWIELLMRAKKLLLNKCTLENSFWQRVQQENMQLNTFSFRVY